MRLDSEPDNWNMLNNLGVRRWKEGNDQDALAAKAEAEGKPAEAAEFRAKAKAFKENAKAQWMHGIHARPTATDICSNLGYAFSEANNLDEAEKYLRKAVELKEISPRPHNNLGRVLLRRGQEREIKLRNAEPKARAAEVLLGETEAKAKTDPKEAEKLPKLRADAEKLRAEANDVAAHAEQLKSEAESLRKIAIVQFERAVELDPSLLEARLNLGEVYTNAKKYDKAKEQYGKIIEFVSESMDKDAGPNFSQAYFGLGQLALAQGNSKEAIEYMKRAITVNPGNMPAMNALAQELFLVGDRRGALQVMRMWFSKLPPPARRQQAELFAGQFEREGKHQQAIEAFCMAAWIFATSPEPQLRDPQTALLMAKGVAGLTNQQDPLALDTLAAAAAANGQFDGAIAVANQAINLANSKGNKALADMISQRLNVYQRHSPYLSKPDGSDRP